MNTARFIGPTSSLVEPVTGSACYRDENPDEECPCEKCTAEEAWLASVTADTITDEQIREWEADVFAHGSEAQKRQAVDLATRALAEPIAISLIAKASRNRSAQLVRAKRMRDRARARCAEILRARSAK